MVLAFAGDSTMTSVFGTRDTLASRPEDAASARRLRRNRHALVTVWARGHSRLHAGRRAELAAHAWRLPAAGQGDRERPRGRRRAGRQPHLQLRPVATRLPTLAAPAALLHGQ